MMVPRPSPQSLRRLACVAIALLCCVPARASLTVLVGEPFGNFGTMMPVGHTAIYLDRICADGPLKLRMCRPGEPAGVVIARYHRIGTTDWVASPVMQFFYAADRPQDVPAYMTPNLAWAMRERYRQRFMEDLVPDGTERDQQTDEWWETAGVAYNRRVWGYSLDTTVAQDEAFVETMNARPNYHLYHLRNTNCANFIADLVNLYYPGTVLRGDRIADFGLMTPKQVARCVAAYGVAHPQLHPQAIEVPQVPGSLRRSRPVRGGAEAALTTKRYLATLLVIQPEVPLVLAVLYMDHGRWKIGADATPASPEAFFNALPIAAGQGAQSAEADVDARRIRDKNAPALLAP